MRLLDAASLQFKEFFEDQIPPYAILSHTWGSSDEEVSFQDMRLEPRILWEDRRYGYSKIVNTCRLALEDRLKYVWVDTCCIDKSSSAELTEAINSMFRWYEKAEICYVHLADVTPQMSLEDGLKNCRWITRGWTLQELIAPRECDFFDSKWTYRGRKTKMTDMLAALTRVPALVLEHEKLPREYTVAQRMSWAAKRKTTRSEDLAYCLLGVFGIHMPMIYGEGEMAFHRLQEEIIRRTSDATIFAWDPKDGAADIVGILAPSPASFENTQSLLNTTGFQPTEFALTNKGVKIVHAHVLVCSPPKKKQGLVYFLQLGKDPTGRSCTGIYLRKVDGDLFCRLNRPRETFWQTKGLRRARVFELYLADFCPSPISQSMILDSRRPAVQIPVPSGFEHAQAVPQRLWDYEDSCFLTGPWGADMVQWVQIAGTLLGHKVELAMLCDRRADNGYGKPVLSIFEKHRFIEHWDYLSQYRRTHVGDPLSWWKLKQDFPALLDHTDSTAFSLQGAAVKVSVSVAKGTVRTREGGVEMYQAKMKIDIEKKGQGKDTKQSR
ncbi:Vegetative incompatibility protein HET-E-1 [Cytospora mali]|uniref:Vegetative incompatibility protein HET-E-1 n=1 Tax=Cytospora mali TaxID=578113 RepID=A0A194UML9_CYTMA|nr:Vegetative incompatibility protein HET-E-1 [Valsa mali var. pyri (nom. inval.)]